MDELAPPASVALLYVATVPAPIRNFLLPYAAHFRALGWRVDAAASGASQVEALSNGFDQVFDLPLSRSILDLRTNARGERAIRDLLDLGYDLVHVHTPIAGFLTRLAVNRMSPDRRPAVAYTAHGFHFHHDGNPLANGAFRTAERVAGRWTDRLVVINEEDRRAAQAGRFVPPGRLVPMPGVGLDLSWYSRHAVGRDALARARAVLGIGLEVPLFVVVGELHPNKRHEDVVLALAELRGQSSHLVLLGEGPQRRRLQALARCLGVGGRVHLPGFVEDVRPIVASSTALVVASRREGLSRAVMEALALEVPVIASTARGNRELVGSDAGIIVPTGDVGGLASAMDRLLHHPAEAGEMGRRGRARMIQDYDLRSVIQRHESMYEAMLAERSRAVGPANAFARASRP